MGEYRSARCVFVGNIPYDATEQQLIEVFQQVGPVVSFRLVFDRESGKPKGYGFCEYRDQETALSAMRNLNNYDFNGRPLRVDFADQGQSGATRHNNPPPVPVTVNPPPITSSSNISPQNPASSAPGTVETINSILEGMTHAQLHEIMYKMKIIVQQSPEQAKQILASNPPLAYALLQIQVILGMINLQTLQRVISKQPVTNVPPQPIISNPPTFPNPTPVPVSASTPVGISPPPTSFSSIEEQHKFYQQIMLLTPTQIEQLPIAWKLYVQQIRSYLSGWT